MIKSHIHSAFKSFLVVLTFTLISFASFSQEIPSTPEAISQGEQLFKANCQACHRVDRKFVGPALAGVYDRAPSIQWIIDFVHNSTAVIQSGDKYAKDLFAE